MMIDISAITPEWLTHRLRKHGHLSCGEVIAIAVRDVDKHHCSLEIQYSTDRAPIVPERLILRGYEPKYTWGAREGIFYTEIAPLTPNAPLPRCFDVTLRDEFGKTYILLKDLAATHFAPAPLEEEKLARWTWERVLEAYLVFHTYWWEHPSISEGHFVRSFGLGVAHEATSPEAIQANQRHFVEQAFPKWQAGVGRQFPAEWQSICERAIAPWSQLFLKRTAKGKALTLIHGDAHLQNVLLPYHAARHYPVIIDWEGFTRGLGVWDLSRLLTASSLSSAHRQALEIPLLQYYHSRLVEAGITDYTLQECYEDYRLCLIANVLLSFEWGDVLYMTSAMHAFQTWGCEELLA